MTKFRSICVAAILILALAIIGCCDKAMAEEASSEFIRQSVGNDTVIVFVHGITGDAVSTWTAENKAYWPALLAKDKTFDAADIFVYSYPTGLWATLSIDELAENMRAVLVVHDIPSYKKIIFIAHSMGGLVTRAYLLKNREVAARTSFAYFISTPTTGSQIASILQFMSSQSPNIKNEADESRGIPRRFAQAVASCAVRFSLLLCL